MILDIEQSDKSIYGWIQRAVAGMTPRQATVTRPGESGGVWVRHIGPGQDTAPESWYRSTVNNVPAGTRGWVIPIGGGKGLFIATSLSEFPPSPHNHDGRYYTEAEVDALLADIPHITPFAANTGSAMHATTNLTYTVLHNVNINVPPGQYRALGSFIAPMRRSVSTGEVWSRIRIGGVESGEFGVGVTPAATNVGTGWFPVSGTFDMDIAVGGGGFTTLSFLSRGGGTAGATNLYRASVSGTLTKIG